MPGGRVVSTIEFQAPDRYRITAPGQPPSLIIGDSMYIDAGGRSMKIPLPKNMLGKFRNEEAIAELEKDVTVEALGPGMVGGQPARKYRFTSTGKHAATTTAWIGVASGRVLQFETTGKAGGKSHSMRMVYSDFDSPAIRIAAPTLIARHNIAHGRAADRSAKTGGRRGQADHLLHVRLPLRHQRAPHDGRIRYIEGNPAHPVNRGVLCAKGSAGIMQHYSPARLTQAAAAHRRARRRASSARSNGKKRWRWRRNGWAKRAHAIPTAWPSSPAATSRRR